MLCFLKQSICISNQSQRPGRLLPCHDFLAQQVRRLEFSAKQGGGRRTLTQRAEKALLEYPWPGNIRELRHAIEQTCIISADTTLGPEAFFGDGLTHWTPPAADGNLSAYLQECERNYIG